MSSFGENTLAPPNPILMAIKGGASAVDQQQQMTRQVLGSVGNSSGNIAILNNKKDLFQQKDIRKPSKQQDNVRALMVNSSAESVIPSDFGHGGFAIYTDETSQSTTKSDGSCTTSTIFEDSENLPPKMGVGLLPSVANLQTTQNQVAIHGKVHNLEEKSRTPFTEIIVDTPGDVKSLSASSSMPTFRERLYEFTEYQPDILSYLKEAEVKFRPKPDYMRKQPDINGNMRTVLVDWVVEVCEEYRLNTETLYLAVSYVDRFLSIMSVVRSKLQLVGTSAMFIAAKFEEIYPPDVADFVYITDDTYTKKQVLRMEQLVLRALSFDMSAPTAYAFVNLYAIMENLPDPVKHLAMYLCELSLLYSAPFLQYLPSRIAAAALAYARLLLNYEGRMWTRAMELTTGYELSHLQQVICELNSVHEKCPQMTQKAVPEKYKAQKYNEVALIEAIELTETMFQQTFDTIAKELEEAVKIMTMQ